MSGKCGCRVESWADGEHDDDCPYELLRAEIRVADDLTHSVIAAREHAEKTLILERDEARAEVERLREENLRLRAVGGDPTAPPVISEGTIRLRRERNEARAEVERLRARIERARALCEQAFPERKQHVSLATIIAALDGE